MHQWRAKLKHFLILSSAGKPIYSRHGDDQLITNYIGVVQTIISFYQSTNDILRGFTAGDVRFVVMSKGPLNLVAITRLPESDSQLRSQLEALYMQILSTLTLPSMERMFAARANYDLRRPLQGTETLLSALADGFTRGSPSTLLSALECLKLRKSHRTTINNTLLKTRSENLLYGLLVASGKLVSVVRPKKHSLHPGDLHLIFNMLFEAGSVKAGGGENWIPLCLPGFNNTGYLYMYVSFLNLEHPTEQMQERPRTSDGADDEVAVLLISAEKESFFELRRMRDDLVEVSSQFLYIPLQSLLNTRGTGMICEDAWIASQMASLSRPRTLSRALRLMRRTMWARTGSEAKFAHSRCSPMGSHGFIAGKRELYTRTRPTGQLCDSASDVSISDVLAHPPGRIPHSLPFAPVTASFRSFDGPVRLVPIWLGSFNKRAMHSVDVSWANGCFRRACNAMGPLRLYAQLCSKAVPLVQTLCPAVR